MTNTTKSDLENSLQSRFSGEIPVEDLNITSVLSPQGIHPVVENITADEEVLAGLGYKQEFKREFSLWSTFAVSFALLGLLPSIASTLWYGMGYAGTPGMTYGWLVAMIGIQSVACSMAELASSMPTSGGLYYAAAVLAPEGWGPLAAWITGWSNWLCQVTSAPSIDYSMASMILGLKSVTDESYEAANWHVWLLTCAIMIAQSVISSMPTKFLARFNSAGSIINSIALFIAFIIILVAGDREDRGLSKFNSSSEVWGNITNQTDWPDGIAILMSFIAIIWTMSGYDSPFHLAEECSNASIATPRAIVMTSGIGGILGWAFQMAIAYTVVDVVEAIGSSDPYIGYLSQCLPKKLVFVISAFTVLSAFFMGQASMIAASRVAYAYGRDGCFPFSRYIGCVNKYTDTPVNAVWMNTIIGCLVLLLIYAGGVAIDAIFSVGAIAAYIGFAIPISMKVIFCSERFKPGPWNMGSFSRPVGFVSIAFVLLMTPIMCFPQYRGENLDAETMNWTVVVYFGPMLFAIFWYLVYAHKFFKGPKINIEHMVHSTNNDDPESSKDIVEGIDPSPTIVQEYATKK